MRKLGLNYQIGYAVLFTIALCGGVLFGLSMNPDQQVPTFTMPTTPVVPTPFASPKPSPVATPAAPHTQESSWSTPDGKRSLIMKTITQASGQTEYSFYVTSAGDPERQFIFTKTLKAPQRMYMPFNSWSPDGKYFFVQEDDGTDVKSFVFKASGEMFKDGETSLDVNTIFAEKNKDFFLKETTGWAAPTLLVINSKNVDGENGPSYWMDVNTKKLTRLSSSFQ